MNTCRARRTRVLFWACANLTVVPRRVQRLRKQLVQHLRHSADARGLLYAPQQVQVSGELNLFIGNPRLPERILSTLAVGAADRSHHSHLHVFKRVCCAALSLLCGHC